jgi:hypothetical protein
VYVTATSGDYWLGKVQYWDAVGETWVDQSTSSVLVVPHDDALDLVVGKRYVAVRYAQDSMDRWVFVALARAGLSEDPGCGLALVLNEETDEEELAVDAEQLAGLGLEANGQCELRVKTKCGLDRDTEGVGVARDDIIGAGLRADPDDVDGCKVAVWPGCHLSAVTDGPVSVTPTTLAGAGLELEPAETEGGCDKLRVKISGVDDPESCPQIQMGEDGGLDLLLGNIIGDGLKVVASEDLANCNNIVPDLGCGLKIEGGKIIVDVGALESESITASAGGCSLEVDPDYITDTVTTIIIESDCCKTAVVSTDLVLDGCKICVINTHGDGSTSKGTCLDICCLVQHCIAEEEEPGSGGVCASGWYCLRDSTGARSCQELECGEQVPEGYVQCSGPHETVEDCQEVCGGGANYCWSSETSPLGCSELAYGVWLLGTEGDTAPFDHSATSFFSPGDSLYSGPYCSEEDAAEGGITPINGTVFSGPHEDCEEITCTDEDGGDYYCCEGDPDPVCLFVEYGWYKMSDASAINLTAEVAFVEGAEVDAGPFDTEAEALAATGSLFIVRSGPYATEEECETACVDEEGDGCCDEPPATLTVNLGGGLESYECLFGTYTLTYVPGSGWSGPGPDPVLVSACEGGENLWELSITCIEGVYTASVTNGVSTFPFSTLVTSTCSPFALAFSDITTAMTLETV